MQPTTDRSLVRSGSERASAPADTLARGQQPVRPFKFCRLAILMIVATIASAAIGCGTTNTHEVTNQLLVSDAIDKAVSQINFEDLRGKTVYLDAKYVEGGKELGQTNVSYILSSLRQQMVGSGCLLQDDRNQCEIVVEPRIGALGTEGQVVTYGIPANKELSTAASIFAQAPVVPTIPEIAFGKSDLKMGAAKVAIFAYYRETREPFWQSGTRLAQSDSKSIWLLGAGPFRRGSIHDDLAFYDRSLKLPWRKRKKPPEFNQPSVPYANELRFRNLQPLPTDGRDPESAEPERLAEQDDAVELTSHEEEVTPENPPASEAPTGGPTSQDGRPQAPPSASGSASDSFPPADGRLPHPPRRN